MIEALKKYPSTTYHLNDLDNRHLFIAAYEASRAKIGSQALEKIRFISGDISNKLKIQDKYDVILIARVLHYFSPSQLRSIVDNIHDLLKPGGRVYAVAITPYVKRYEKFIPEYKKRIADGEKFPGYVKSLDKWVNKAVLSQYQNSFITDEPFMFLDKDILTRVFKKRKFKIIKCDLTGLEYYSPSWSLDGRENVVLIAEKEK